MSKETHKKGSPWDIIWHEHNENTRRGALIPLESLLEKNVSCAERERRDAIRRDVEASKAAFRRLPLVNAKFCQSQQ